MSVKHLHEIIIERFHQCRVRGNSDFFAGGRVVRDFTAVGGGHVLWIGIRDDRYRNLNRTVAEQWHERIKIEAFNTDEADAVIPKVKLFAFCQQAHHQEFGDTLDENHAPGKK